MDEKTHADMSGQPGRTGLLAIIGLLVVALVVGAIVVARSGTRTSEPDAAGGGGGVKPEAIEAALAAAQVYIRDKQYGEAATILEKLVERAPTDQGARLAYAQALLGQQKHTEAYAQYEAAIALNQTISSQRLKEGAGGAVPVRDPVTAQLHFEAGTCANVAGKFDRAIEHYWMAQTLDASEARYPLFLAMMQIKTGDEPAANASLVRAVMLNPDLAEAWGTMAELALRQNHLSLAAQHVEKARTLQPEVARWRIIEARIANRTGDPERAARMLTALDAQTRADRQVVTLLSESYGLMKRPRDAAELWASAAKDAGADPEAHYQAALWFGRAGDKAKAEEHARAAAMMGHAGAKELVAEAGR